MNSLDTKQGEPAVSAVDKKTETNNQKKSEKVNKKKTITISVVVIALLLFVVLGIGPVRTLIFKGPGQTQEQEYVQYTVARRTITNSLTGTGTLEPYDSYTVTATVTGDILSAEFEEMDQVLEDQVLYVVDSEDVQDDIEDKKEDVSEAYEDYLEALEDYNDLYVYSDYTGTIRQLYIEEGDNVNGGGQVAYIVDSETMLLEVPFFASETDYFVKGSSATVSFSSTGEVLTGVVTEISNLTELNATNSFTRKVTISVGNPGGITFGMKAYASIIGTDGVTYSCCGEGTFKYNEEETITSDVMGEVESLSVREGDRVRKGQLIATLSSKTLDNQVEQYKKAWESQQDQLEAFEELLEDHTIKAPISGTVVQKNYKALDTIGSNSMSSTTTLAIIYDMSKLTFDMNIDELDLSLVKVGQEVIVTSDSLVGERFSGIISKKSIVGTTQNGTTSYPITIEIDGNDKLLPGMNVDAEILVEKAENVLAIPVSAVSRGNTVRLKKGEEIEVVTVELGVSDDDYIEVISGLSEGDIIEHRPIADAPVQSLFAGMMNMGGMSGGMPSGGMPSGGMGGMRGGIR